MNVGLLLGFVGVSIFAFTLPVTKLGLAAGLNAPFISFGRAALAAALAAIVLVATRSRIPTREEWKFIALAMIGIVVGWPTMSTLGLLTATPSHAAIVNGLLPFATAMVGAILSNKWPRKRFWIFALAGAVLVSGYAAWLGGGKWVWADGVFFVGVILGGIGYAAGALAAKNLTGWQVISWALLLGLPITLPVSLYFAPEVNAVSAEGWWCFAYLAVMSQFVGFFFWYAGLAKGGIAKVSQVQLLQMFMTLAVSAWLVGETLTITTWIVAAATVGIIALSKKFA
jgi:drug/metabolite transporter (DMT)-like permease